MLVGRAASVYDRCMELLGKVDHGVIVPQGDVHLPEGAMVRIMYDAATVEAPVKVPGYRVEFPLVRSKYPGSVHLTNQRIQELLDEDDVSP